MSHCGEVPWWLPGGAQVSHVVISGLQIVNHRRNFCLRCHLSDSDQFCFFFSNRTIIIMSFLKINIEIAFFLLLILLND